MYNDSTIAINPLAILKSIKVMTETFFIEIHSEQKEMLMGIFKAFKVRVKPVSQEKTQKLIWADINCSEKDKVLYDEFIEAIESSNAKADSTIQQGQNLSDFLNGIETELEIENRMIKLTKQLSKNRG